MSCVLLGCDGRPVAPTHVGPTVSRGVGDVSVCVANLAGAIAARRVVVTCSRPKPTLGVCAVEWSRITIASENGGAGRLGFSRNFSHIPHPVVRVRKAPLARPALGCQHRRSDAFLMLVTRLSEPGRGRQLVACSSGSLFQGGIRPHHPPTNRAPSPRGRTSQSVSSDLTVSHNQCCLPLVGARTDWPRMADFAKWATAAESGVGWPSGAFMDAYLDNRREAHARALDDNPLAEAIILRSSGWTGTATDLLTELKEHQVTSLPSTPQGLMKRLNELAPNLRAQNVVISSSRDGHNSRKVMTITRNTDLTEREAAYGSVRRGPDKDAPAPRRATLESPSVSAPRGWWPCAALRQLARSASLLFSLQPKAATNQDVARSNRAGRTIASADSAGTPSVTTASRHTRRARQRLRRGRVRLPTPPSVTAHPPTL